MTDALPGNAVDPNEILALQEAANSPPEAIDVAQRGIDAMDLLMKGGWVMIRWRLFRYSLLCGASNGCFPCVELESCRELLFNRLTQMIRESDLLPVSDAYRLCANILPLLRT